MIKHNLLLFFRNIRKHGNIFSINVIGLSSGLICVLLITLWVIDELNVDRFHLNNERLYQVMLTFEDDSGFDTTAWTPAPLGNALVEEIPEVERYVTTFSPGNNGIISIDGGTFIRPNSIYASTDFFDVFSFKLIEGDRKQVLQNPNSVVISEELAQKLFGTSNQIIGRSLELKQEKLGDTFMITGVFLKPPINSTLQFDVVFPFNFFLNRVPEFNDWAYNDPNTYVLLKKETSIVDVNEKVTKLLKSKPKVEIVSTYLQQFSKNYLNGTFKNGKPSGGRIDYLWLFSFIAILILLIACINFMNLSTARAFRRVKEIGVKKVLGAQRKTLVFQHFWEAFLTSFISLLIAVLVIVIFLPAFNILLHKQIVLEFNLQFISMLLLIIIATSLLAGIYPALYLSGFNSLSLLLGRFQAKPREMWIRKGLVIFQFSASITLIISILAISKQVDFIQNKNLGLDKEHVIVLKNDGAIADNLEPFLQEVKNIPGVVSATSSYHELLTNGSSTTGLSWEGKDPNAEITFKYILANYDFIEVLNIKMKEGRSFSREFNTDSQGAVILNEMAIKTMGISNPVGKTINVWGEDRVIVGVVSDFNFQSLYETVHPLFMKISDSGQDIFIRLRAGNQHMTISRLKDFCRDFNNGLDPDFHFLNLDYQKFYESEQRVATLSKYFGVLAILITCLGLFGLATFAAERRRKEIGIRKVMGQSAAQVSVMFSSQFAKLVVVAFLIASPIAYISVENWLSGFAYHAPIQPWYFIGSGLMALVLAIVTVAFQAIDVANKNPVDVLREQ